MSAIPAGTVFHTYLGPIPAENSQAFDFGPVTVILEHRQVTKAAILASFADDPVKLAAAQAATPDDLDDSGISFHVVGKGDQHEYLRFDCLRGAPHYHYNLRPTPEVPLANVEVKYDQISNGDPVEWTIARLGDRLPPMLAAAGAADLADQLDQATVAQAVRQLREFIDTASGAFADALSAARGNAG
jgi:hypothetical protein